jgi:hypothetical protein
MSRFFFGMLAGAAMLYVGMHFHFVRGDGGVFLVPKTESSISDVYVDIRGFRLDHWKAHKPLAKAIHVSNQKHLAKETPPLAFRDKVEDVVSGLMSR